MQFAGNCMQFYILTTSRILKYPTLANKNFFIGRAKFLNTNQNRCKTHNPFREAPQTSTNSSATDIIYDQQEVSFWTASRPSNSSADNAFYTTTSTAVSRLVCTYLARSMFNFRHVINSTRKKRGIFSGTVLSVL